MRSYLPAFIKAVRIDFRIEASLSNFFCYIVLVPFFGQSNELFDHETVALEFAVNSKKPTGTVKLGSCILCF